MATINIKKLGKKEIMLGKAMEGALKKWIHKRRQKEIAQEMLQLIEEGINLGGIKIKSRGELYDGM